MVYKYCIKCDQLNTPPPGYLITLSPVPQTLNSQAEFFTIHVYLLKSQYT